MAIKKIIHHDQVGFILGMHPAARVRGKRSENFSSGERKKENDGETSGTPQVPAELGGRHVETKLSPWKPSRSQLDRTVNVAGRGSC